MSYLVISCLLALAASVSADGLGGLAYAPGYSLDAHTVPRYAFEYSVKDPSTGDNKAQWERREGDGVKGSYSLVEPGGGIRTVDYWADSKTGFNAIIRRDGPKVHPPTLRVAPIVKAPMFAPAIGPIAPLYGGLSTASVYKISEPAPDYTLPISAAPILTTAPALAPITKALLPAPLLPLPLMSNYLQYLPSLGSLGLMNKY